MYGNHGNGSGRGKPPGFYAELELNGLSPRVEQTTMPTPRHRDETVRDITSLFADAMPETQKYGLN